MPDLNMFPVALYNFNEMSQAFIEPRIKHTSLLMPNVESIKLVTSIESDLVSLGRSILFFYSSYWATAVNTASMLRQ